jgi:hypothetical protein
MRRLLILCVVLGMVLGACSPATPEPAATPTSIAIDTTADTPSPAATATPTPTPTPTPTHTPTSTPEPIAVPTDSPTPTPTFVPAGGQQEEEPPPFPDGYAFEFSWNYSGDATIVGKAHTCTGLSGPWSLEVAVSGSPEPGATIETTGEAVFTLPEDGNEVEVTIPTTGTGTFDFGDGVGEGTITDPLLFIFRLRPDELSAEITVTSTGEGIVVMHLPDAPDIPVTFGTVFAADPTFEVRLTPYDCP